MKAEEGQTNSDEKRATVQNYTPLTAERKNSDIKLPPIRKPKKETIPKERSSLYRDTTINTVDIPTEKLNLKDCYLGIFPESDGKKKVSLNEFIWEYVIVLQNPDFDTDNQEKITHEGAEEIYRKCFKVKNTLSPHQQTLNFANELTSFLDAFQTLDDFEDGKKYKNGGSILSEGPNEFIKQSGPPKDFLSMIANVIIFKLVNDLSLKVKTLLSTDGQYIFLILSADDDDLAKEAERTRYKKELELSLTDLISLIPCDNALRPFNMLRSADPNLKELFKKVKGFLSKALSLGKNTGKINYKYDEVGVTPGQWEAYKLYLKFLDEGIQKIESSITSHKHQMISLKSLLKDAIEKINLQFPPKDRLLNLWGRLRISTIFAPYAEYRRSKESEDELADLWKTHQIDESGKRSLFKNIERIRLLCSYIYTEISLNALQENELIVAHYPLHNNWLLTGQSDRIIENIPPDEKLLKAVLLDLKKTPSNSLIDSWSTSLIKQSIPLSKIRNYFGEKIALYFEFLRIYQISLVIPGLTGIIIFAIQQSYAADHSNVIVANAFYCIFITIWGTIFLEKWKRRQSTLSVIWGQTDYEKIEIPRPQFRGELRRDPVTDDMVEIYYESKKRLRFYFLSAVVTFIIICMVLACVAGIIILKQNTTSTTLSAIYSIVNAIQILIFNVIYSKLVIILTNLENHKTQNQYEDSLVIKTFVFQFVNSFNSLVYIAFIKCDNNNDAVGDCKHPNTGNNMNELFVQLISIFLVSYVKNLLELGIPYGKYLICKWRKNVIEIDVKYDSFDLRNDIEGQLYLGNYVTYETDGTIDDYLELAVQFGYLTFFSIAFPLSGALLFIGLWLEMLTDKLKILKLIRRPIPLANKDIGTWESIFSIMVGLSILSNSALFCFTAPTFRDWDAADKNKPIIFVVLVAILYIFRSQLMSWIPDIEAKYKTIFNRHEHIVEKHLRGNSTVKEPDNTEMFDKVLYYSKLKTEES